MSMLLEISQNQLSLYVALIGVAGVLLGTILGYLLSWFSKLGLKKFILQKTELQYYYGLVHGCSKYEDKPEDNGQIAKSTKINLSLLITNSSDIPYNINTLKLKIKQKKYTETCLLYNRDASQIKGGLRIYENLNTLTINGKSSIYLNLYGNLEEIFTFSEKTKLYVEFIDVKGKIRKKKVIGKSNETKI